MRLSIESCVLARADEGGIIEDCRDLVPVGVDRGVAERRDEVVIVRRRLARLDRIRLRTGSILHRDESLRELNRRGRLLVVTTAPDEAERHERYEEWKGESRRGPILRSAAAAYKRRSTCYFNNLCSCRRGLREWRGPVGRLNAGRLGSRAP